LALGGATVSAQGMWETRQGETLHLRATIHTARAIERPAIGVVLANGFAGRVCGFSTVNYGQALPAIDPGEFTFEFRVPLFVPAGTYLCEVTVADLATNPPTLMHTWTEAAQLQVRWSGYSIAGVHDGGAEIEFAGMTYSNAAERERRQSLSPAERTIANVAPSGLAAAAMAKVTAPTHSDIVAPVRNAT
ncbi:MAG: Wzt carbohydrate-binding domain-containing protein, partial [Tepidisphaeraceae bacterium]